MSGSLFLWHPPSKHIISQVKSIKTHASFLIYKPQIISSFIFILFIHLPVFIFSIQHLCFSHAFFFSPVLRAPPVKHQRSMHACGDASKWASHVLSMVSSFFQLMLCLLQKRNVLKYGNACIHSHEEFGKVSPPHETDMFLGLYLFPTVLILSSLWLDITYSLQDLGQWYISQQYIFLELITIFSFW